MRNLRVLAPPVGDGFKTALRRVFSPTLVETEQPPLKMLAAADVARRGFIRASAAALGAGLVGAHARAAYSAQVAQASVPGSPAIASPVAPAQPLTMSSVFAEARRVMFPVCRMCPECDGVACAGEVPGIGGSASGASFRNNYKSLQRVELRLRALHEIKNPDLSMTLFGQKLSLPAIAAPTGGTTYNMGGKLTEAQFTEAILGGCTMAGTLGAIADGIGDPVEVFEERLRILTRLGGKATVGLKPRTQSEIIARIRKAEESGGVVAITIDVDAAGRAARALPGQTVEPKSIKQIAELVKATSLPIIIKGIMTPEDALMVLESGAAGIVVSNHGGRVLDTTPGSAEVLPAIADKVKGRMILLVDGTVRYGHDVLKYQALGADAVLVGRHLIKGAHGGGPAGVALFLRTMQQELQAAMVLTGTPSVRNVARSLLV